MFNSIKRFLTPFGMTKLRVIKFSKIPCFRAERQLVFTFLKDSSLRSE
jgi:hypothetical protein